MSPIRTTAALMMTVVLALTSLDAQRSGTFSGGSGTGRGSDTVLGTWEASGTSRRSDMLDLLVLWRGRQGWWQTATDMGVGGTDHVHRFRVGRVQVELRYDPAARVVRIQGQIVRLGDDNVVLVDNVDTPNDLTVVGTLRIDRRFPDPALGDPVEQIIRRTPELAAFVR